MKVEHSKKPIIIGKKPSEDDEFYIVWGRETLKNGITLQNDLLKQILTLNTALISVSIFYEKLFKGCEGLFCLFILSFLVSLAISLVGIFPNSSGIDLDSPSEIKTHKQQVFIHKQNLVKYAFIFITIGFSVILIRALILLYVSV